MCKWNEESHNSSVDMRVSQYVRSDPLPPSRVPLLFCALALQVAPTGGARAGARRGLAVDDEYVGCFADDMDRVMTDMFVDNDMTPNLCRSHCEDNGASYYATQVRLCAPSW